jgi:sugar lactone lactonase YvrE
MISSPASIALLLVCLLIAGCSADFNAPPSLTSETNAVGTISGNLHGGQQPIANAHIFVLAVGLGGDAGPGIAASTANKATSLITSTTSGAAFDSTVGGYYVLTDGGGNFTVTSDYTCTLSTQVYILALQGEPDGIHNNSAIGMMAVLGNCPSGHTLAGQVGFVDVNEVSTIAAAYALAGFATDSYHISSNGSTLAQTGVFNAAANAAQMYNISAYPYTARATTPSGGTVPQALINSLADILAACVNTTSSTSSNCNTLFSNAKSSGSSGTTATDTATAAINIAHNAGANVSALFALASSTPPFVGLGTAPSDFSIGITYSGFLNPSSVAIDASGNAWIANTNGGPSQVGSVIELSPLGVATTFTGNGINTPLGIAIDQAGNAWAASLDITKISNGVASLITFADDANGAWYIAIDKNNTPWVSTYQDTKLYDLTQSGGEVTGSPYTYSNSATPEQIAIDSNDVVWSVYGNDAGLLKLTNPGTSATLTEYLQSGLPGVRANSGIAIDSSNTVWAVGQTSGTTNGISNECLAKINSSGTITNCYTDTAMQGDGVAIDGSGNIWVSNGQVTGGIGAVEFNPAGTVISPAGGFSGGAQSYPISIAVDGSGDVWLPGDGNSTGTTVVELIGVATPVVTPISPIYPGKSTTGLGVRP